MAEQIFINVKDESGTKQRTAIEAIVRGKLALHPSVNERGYTITHIPTGYAAITDIPKLDATAILQRIRNLDWEFTSPDAVPDPTRRACQRVAVEFGVKLAEREA